MKPSLFDYDRRDWFDDVNRRERAIRFGILMLQIGVVAVLMGKLLEWAIINPNIGV